jgi:branched-chain amino acid transport system substrate-binding protein
MSLLPRRTALGLLAGGAAALGAGRARADIPGRVLKLGVLSDMSGPFADQAGPGSVVAAKLAAEDFAAEANGLTVEVLSADHQNKPDVGIGIARSWVDQAGVGAVVDLPNSAVGLAVSDLMREKGRVCLASSTATSDLTGRFCAPTTVQWVTDTWAQANTVVRSVMAQGGDSWYFVTVDYALGTGLERDATSAVLAGGGRVLGSTRHPLNNADFSSALLQAQSSGAKVIGLANTGADIVNTIKQAAEFGVTRKGVSVAALFIQLSDIYALGAASAQGLLLCEAFYWDLNEATRAWSARFGARMNGRMPTMNHAGVYSSSLAWMRAARDAGTLDGVAVVAQMRAKPIDDPLFGPTTIRADGRVVHAMHLFRVKAPQAGRSPWDLYEHLSTIPGEQAFRPLDGGGCKLG